MPASIEAKGFTITIASRPLAALIWHQADDTVWVATIDDEYAGIAEFDNGRFLVLNNHSRLVGSVPTIAEAEVLLRRAPVHRVPRGVANRPHRFGRGERSRPHAPMTGSTLGPVLRTRPRGENRIPVTSTYNELLGRVRGEGLLKRRRGFYITMFAVLSVGLLGAAAGFVLLGDSWFQLLIAAAFGLLFTQFAFLGHEASYRQVFASGPRNDRAGRFIATWVVGMSYQWWMTKHTRHHANPNTEGKDPDIAFDTISFTETDAARQRGLLAAITRRQGYLFFPLLLLEGVNLHVTSIRSLFARGPVERRIGELVAIGLRLSIYFMIVFLMLPVGMAFAFLGVQLAVFGVYMGASFAPNHKGMPLLPAGSRVDFLNKQVLTSRNIRGGWTMSVLMGGLNHQIEHHLFPSMPRPHLRRARELVREHCAAHDIPYTETGLVNSYRIVIRYLNTVGLAARDPFDCPAARRFRRA